ncbi:MAG: SpoIIE family protein phosphatase, partial [Streptomyces sp.]
EVLGRAGADLLAGTGADSARNPFVAGPSWDGQAVLRHRDGHEVTAALLARRRATAEGPDWLLVRVSRPRLRPRQDDALMRWGFREIPCILALFDTRLLLVRANTDMERSVGLTEDQIRGLRPSEMIPEHPEPGRVEQAMRRAMRTGERQHLRMVLRVPGEIREHAWAVWVSPARDEQGGVRGVCFVAQDVSEQYDARQRLQLLNEAGARVGTTLDIARTAQQLADVAVPQLADFAGVDLMTFLQDGDKLAPDPLPGAVTMRRTGLQSVTRGESADLVEVGDVTAYPPLSPAVECLAGGRAAIYETSDRFVEQWASGDRTRADRLRARGIRSVVVAPLCARGVTLGAAIFLRRSHREPFGHEDVLLAEELAARGAVCIDNARLYNRERDTAETLQRDLLPQQLPEQSAVEVASRYLPAEGKAGVGGDWFDVIPLSGARVALAVGDVVGHGLQASAAMGRFRTAVRALAEMGLPPDELLSHLDDMVTRLSEEAGTRSAAYTGGKCLYAVYDPVSRRCTAARAGNFMPAVVTPAGTVDFLELPAGLPLGVGGLPYEARETELPEGSVLALFTKGLVVTRDRYVDEGLGLLRRVLAEPALSLEALCDHVLAAMLPDHPQDDAALLLARTRALNPDQVATWDVPADPAGVSRIRSDAAGQLARWGLQETSFTAELVVSELVTNAIRYGLPPIRLRLIYDRELICEVTDAGIAAPHLRPARLMDEGGRGLLLVAQLSRRWGTRFGPEGKTIWAEQSLSGSPTLL